MKMNRVAREKLVEKGIDWKQTYTDKTLFLKEQFEDVVGPGSYFRFEGTDITSGDSYYCIIGPAKIHHPRAKFFAGVRKLPATFSAGGKYFDSLDSAARYARETWGVDTPRELKPYTSSSLIGISKKITKWKERRENEKEDESKSDVQINKESGISSVAQENIEEQQGLLQETKEQINNQLTLSAAFNRAIVNLIKVATELDEEGKIVASEEIHNVIRKYQERI